MSQKAQANRALSTDQFYKNELTRLGVENPGDISRAIDKCMDEIVRLGAKIATTANINTAVATAAPSPLGSESDLSNGDVLRTANSKTSVDESATTTTLCSVSSRLQEEKRRRQRRAEDLLSSFALPAAVQSQMIGATNPSELRFSEAKLAKVIIFTTSVFFYR
ncbi:unnamed protein product [Protopolystoma xenopodis]|uniref:Uncharacterized protein n=1 Tax=Protopolystoma xenopodis TaxID=117903 RepID=A0A448X8D6_9PLAT|nr:unnamed protein product [Protopolystoma xenopodis]